MLSAILASTAINAAVIFESDETVTFLNRCVTASRTTQCDLLAPSGGLYLCLATDKDGNPIATAQFTPDAGSVTFFDLPAGRIADIHCRPSR